jgi:hypothetical protein
MESDQDVKEREPVFIDVYVRETDLDVTAYAPADFCRALARELALLGVESCERFCSPCG